ncbi:hypothetical protein HDU96_010322 [Phlyctochytrium bullatum]|nr:hypothetical protein HDU96_010322 [Phlyctochytrium bullatum]
MDIVVFNAFLESENSLELKSLFQQQRQQFGLSASSKTDEQSPSHTRRSLKDIQGAKGPIKFNRCTTSPAQVAFLQEVRNKLSKERDLSKKQQWWFPPSPSVSSKPDYDKYVVKPVFVWDPLEQYPEAFRQVRCKGCQRLGSVKSEGWSNSIRTVYGLKHKVFLISKYHGCTTRQCRVKFNAHDPDVMKQFPVHVQEDFPFFLTEKSAITNDLKRMIVRLKPKNGMGQVFKVIKDMYLEYFLDTMYRFIHHCHAYEKYTRSLPVDKRDHEAFAILHKCREMLGASEDILDSCTDVYGFDGEWPSLSFLRELTFELQDTEGDTVRSRLLSLLAVVAPPSAAGGDAAGLPVDFARIEMMSSTSGGSTGGSVSHAVGSSEVIGTVRDVTDGVEEEAEAPREAVTGTTDESVAAAAEVDDEDFAAASALSAVSSGSWDDSRGESNEAAVEGTVEEVMGLESQTSNKRPAEESAEGSELRSSRPRPAEESAASTTNVSESRPEPLRYQPVMPMTRDSHTAPHLPPPPSYLAYTSVVQPPQHGSWSHHADHMIPPPPSDYGSRRSSHATSLPPLSYFTSHRPSSSWGTPPSSPATLQGPPSALGPAPLPPMSLTRPPLLPSYVPNGSVPAVAPQAPSPTPAASTMPLGHVRAATRAAGRAKPRCHRCAAPQKGHDLRVCRDGVCITDRDEWPWKGEDGYSVEELLGRYVPYLRRKYGPQALPAPGAAALTPDRYRQQQQQQLQQHTQLGKRLVCVHRHVVRRCGGIEVAMTIAERVDGAVGAAWMEAAAAAAAGGGGEGGSSTAALVNVSNRALLPAGAAVNGLVQPALQPQEGGQTESIAAAGAQTATWIEGVPAYAQGRPASA